MTSSWALLEEQVPLEREDVASLHPSNSMDVLGPVCSEQDLSGSQTICDELQQKVDRDIASYGQTMSKYDNMC